jgi:hypothetical protein
MNEQRMAAWSSKAKELEEDKESKEILSPELAAKIESLNEPKAKTQGKVAELGLPMFARLETYRDDLLINPDLYFGQMSSERYYISASSTDGQKRERIFGAEVDKQAVIDFVTDNPDLSQLILMEYFPQVAAGNLVISSDQTINLEGVIGRNHGVLNAGETPDFSVRRDELSGIFRYEPNWYEIVPGEIREGIWKVFQCIPHHEPDDDFGRYTNYLPGRYEFCFVPRGGGTFADIL